MVLLSPSHWPARKVNEEGWESWSAGWFVLLPYIPKDRRSETNVSLACERSATAAFLTPFWLRIGLFRVRICMPWGVCRRCFLHFSRKIFPKKKLLRIDKTNGEFMIYQVCIYFLERSCQRSLIVCSSLSRPLF